MSYYLLKLFISALIIVAVSEFAKRNTGIAALLASLPLTSLLAFIWLKFESTTNAQIAELSIQIFWLVIPSLVLFLVLAWMLRMNANFWLSLGLAIAATAALYLALLPLLRRVGVQL